MGKRMKAILAAGAAALCLLAALVLVTSDADARLVPAALLGKTQFLAGGLEVIDKKEGSGDAATAGKTVKVQYSGKLDNGKVFDSGDISFPLGAGHVIKGWDMGVAGMKVGGERKLVIPPALAYGAAGTPGGPIPPNARLTFDVKLLNVDQRG